MHNNTAASTSPLHPFSASPFTLAVLSFFLPLDCFALIPRITTTNTNHLPISFPSFIRLPFRLLVLSRIYSDCAPSCRSSVFLTWIAWIRRGEGDVIRNLLETMVFTRAGGKKRVAPWAREERTFEDPVADGCTGGSLLSPPRRNVACFPVEVKVPIDVRTPRPHPSMFLLWLACRTSKNRYLNIASLNIE